MEPVSTSASIALIIFILNIMVILQVLTSAHTAGYKLGWTAVILILPVLGLIFYFFFDGASMQPVRN